jgi:hypothetical protein
MSVHDAGQALILFGIKDGFLAVGNYGFFSVAKNLLN